MTDAPVVLASCSHDTAAAVAAVPGVRRAHVGIHQLGHVVARRRRSCSSPVLTREAREAGFTNEAGIDGTVRFLKNRAGMWVLEECVASGRDG